MPIDLSGSGVANVSTAQYTLVLGSYSPRVVGESNTGGRIATNDRSPTSNDSPSVTQRHRRRGKSKQFVWRSTMAQLHTTVAFVQAVNASSRLPVWSTSSWDRKIHLTSFGSTIENTSSCHCLRFAGVPVSTTTGSDPRITIELM